MSMNFQKIDSELFEVESQSGHGTYVVDLLEKSCTCPHFRYRGVQCKHIKAVTPVESLTVETIPTILADISKSIQESAHADKKREGLIYTDDPPGLLDWFDIC